MSAFAERLPSRYLEQKQERNAGKERTEYFGTNLGALGDERHQEKCKRAREQQSAFASRDMEKDKKCADAQGDKREVRCGESAEAICAVEKNTGEPMVIKRRKIRMGV